MPLNSETTVQIVDALCEGPIYGLVGAHEHSIYLNETPIRDKARKGDNEGWNFPDNSVDWDHSLGGRSQNVPYLEDNTVVNTTVNVEVGSNYSEVLNEFNEVKSRDYGEGEVIRTITDPEVDRVKLLFTIPKLFCTAMEGLAKGQMFWATIDIKIYIQSAGGNWKKQQEKSLKGISVSNYQWDSSEIDLEGEGPWNIKVVKNVPSSTYYGHDHAFEIKYKKFEDISEDTPLAQGRGNQLIWNSINEIKKTKSNYAYTSLVALTLGAETFSSLPNRAYHIRGRKVAIPHNAIVRKHGKDGEYSLEFSGPFNGSLKGSDDDDGNFEVEEHYTTCPVSCFYDLLTNKRYGCGNHINANNISWVDLYPLARYANQLVDNPDGTREARFSLNVVMAGSKQAYGVLQDLTSTFRGMSYWASNTVQIGADHGAIDEDGDHISTDPVAVYTNSSVLEGGFNYEGSGLQTRATSVMVRYMDMDNLGKPNFVIVEKPELITKYGFNKKQLIAFGTTSKWQARRLGRWVLAVEELSSRVVTFVTGLDGLLVRPGQVFAVADEMRSGSQLSGRIANGASTTSITLDRIITNPPEALSPKLTCVLPDGTVETKDISNINNDGSVSVITTSAFSQAPQSQSVWSFQNSAVTQQKFRCISINEGEEKGQYKITGVEHNDSIYEYTETTGDGTLEYANIFQLNTLPNQPVDFKVTNQQIVQGNNTINNAVFSWASSNNNNAIVSHYLFKYKVGDGNWESTQNTTNNDIQITNLLPESTVTGAVRSVGSDGQVSKWAEVQFTVPSPSMDEQEDKPTQVVPPDAESTYIESINDRQVNFYWSVPATKGVNQNELVAIIRHSPKTDGTGTWTESTEIARVKAQTNQATLGLMNGEYLVKFEDSNRVRSVNAKSSVINLPNEIPALLIETVRNDSTSPKFQGDKHNCLYVESFDGLILDSGLKIDDVPDFDALTKIDNPISDFEKQGQYTFPATKDLGGVFTVNLKRHINARSLYPDDTIDGREEVDSWADVDGNIVDHTNAELYFRQSNGAILDTQVHTEDNSQLLFENSDTVKQDADVTYGPWIPLRNGSYTGRTFQFMVQLTSENVKQTPLIDELGYTMEMVIRTEKSFALTTSTSTYTATFAKAFYQAPSISITAFDLASGDFYVVTNITTTGFDITMKNSSGSAIARQFQYQAVGYGSKEG